jgi:hypothetical protein
MSTAKASPKAEERRLHARRTVAVAARIRVAEGATVDDRLLSELCVAVGLHPHVGRQLFPDADSLLDTITDEVVAECAARLDAAARGFRPSVGGEGVGEVAVTIANAVPLDRTGISVRAARRLRALRRPDDGPGAAVAERRFVDASAGALAQLLARVGLRFEWPEMLAARVILQTYERSLESWLLAGGEASDFANSPYIRRALPKMLARMTVPTSTGQTGGRRSNHREDAS